MRVLVVSHYFPPEVGAPQTRLSELARLWAEAGDDVTVLTGMPNHPTGIVPPAYRRHLRLRQRVDGYGIVRTWSYATPNEAVARKTLGHLSFMVSALVLGGRWAGPADVVVVSSPTFLSIFVAWTLARVRRARLVVEIRDLWPAAMVELGVLAEGGRVARLLEALELAAYRAADAVVVVTDGFRDNLLSRGVPAGKVHVVRNGADLERFRPADHPDSEVMRARLGAGPGETLVLYAGAHGISHGLATVVDAAAKLGGAPIHVALVGEGADKAAVADRVAELGLTNVSMHPAVPAAEMPGLLAAADICLVPLRDVPIFASFIPSKLFELLAAERAVVGSVRGESAEILREAGAEVVAPEDAGALAHAIAALAADPARRAAMGRQGRAYVATHFDRRVLARDYRDLLRSVVDGTGR